MMSFSTPRDHAYFAHSISQTIIMPRFICLHLESTHSPSLTLNFAVSLVSHLYEAILTNFYNWAGSFIGTRRIGRRVTSSSSGHQWRTLESQTVEGRTDDL